VSLPYASTTIEESNPQAFAGLHCNLIATACNPSPGFGAKRAIRTKNYNPTSREIDGKARVSSGPRTRGSGD